MIRLFAASNFNGGEIRRDASDPSFVDDGFNDVISSVIVQEGVYTLFQDTNFQGRSITVASRGGPDGNGLYPDPSTLGGLNDFFSSIRRNA
jgi:hypothetical protein